MEMRTEIGYKQRRKSRSFPALVFPILWFSKSTQKEHWIFFLMLYNLLCCIVAPIIISIMIPILGVIIFLPLSIMEVNFGVPLEKAIIIEFFVYFVAAILIIFLIIIIKARISKKRLERTRKAGKMDSISGMKTDVDREDLRKMNQRRGSSQHYDYRSEDPVDYYWKRWKR